MVALCDRARDRALSHIPFHLWFRSSRMHRVHIRLTSANSVNKMAFVLTGENEGSEAWKRRRNAFFFLPLFLYIYLSRNTTI